MKNFILLFSLLITNLILNAQDYVPLAIEGAQWVIYFEDDDNLPPYIDYYYGYRIEGNIIINGVNYKKVYKRHFTPINTENYPVTAPFIIDHEYLYGAVRDDVPNKKVFAIQFCNTEYPYYSNECNCDVEFLMFDFELNVNDVYNFEDFCNVYTNIYVGEIVHQSIFDENRQIQRIYDGNTNNYINEQVIEGIGTSFGLFESIGVLAGPPYQYLTNYCVGTDEECLQDFLLTTNDHFLKKINIYPNPTKDFINIDLQNSLKSKVQIFNIFGKELFNKQFTQNFISIDISNFTKGIYILKINNKTTKLIKQ